MSLRSRIRGGQDCLSDKVATAAQFLTLRLVVSIATEVICDDPDGLGHAPRYLDVRLQMKIYAITITALSLVAVVWLWVLVVNERNQKEKWQTKSKEIAQRLVLTQSDLQSLCDSIMKERKNVDSGVIELSKAVQDRLNKDRVQSVTGDLPQ